jgi:hypothetical protein
LLSSALQSYCLQFLRIELDIVALGDLVALDDLGRRDLLPCGRIHFPVLDPVSRGLVELVEADLFPFGARRV